MAQETWTTDLSTAAGARWEFRPEGGRTCFDDHPVAFKIM